MRHEMVQDRKNAKNVVSKIKISSRTNIFIAAFYLLRLTCHPFAAEAEEEAVGVVALGAAAAGSGAGAAEEEEEEVGWLENERSRNIMQQLITLQIFLIYLGSGRGSGGVPQPGGAGPALSICNFFTKGTCSRQNCK